MFFFFFFKQKTAYEIRKGDWSSDVCSSDLLRARARQPASSSATRRRMVSSWSSTCASTLSPSYTKFVLQRLQPAPEQTIDVALSQRPARVPEGAVPGHTTLPSRDSGAPILVEDFE